jgi:hypothetical protein
MSNRGISIMLRSWFILISILLLAIYGISSAQMEIRYSTAQPGDSGYSISQTSSSFQEDEGLTPARSHYTQRKVQVLQTSSDEGSEKIPNALATSGQARSDGTVNSYTNIGSSGNANSQAFFSFDISSIPKGAIIRSATLEFPGWEMVGAPFFKLGCLNVFPASYRMLSTQAYSNTLAAVPYMKICSPAQLNTPQGCADLSDAVQAALGQERFQLRMQFDKGGAGTEYVQPLISSYAANRSSSLSNDYLSTVNIRPGYSDFTSSSSSFLQTMKDMGLDQSFAQSDFSENGALRNYGYILLTSGMNLSELGITPEMIDEAMDLGRVRVAYNPMYSEVTQNSTVDGLSRAVSDCSRLISRTVNGYAEGCLDCNNNGICDDTENPSKGTSGSSCPEGYCTDSNNDGVCDAAHIGWISRDPQTENQLKGRHAEYGRSVENLTGVFSIEKFQSLNSGSASCCPDFDSNGYCDLPQPQPCPYGQTRDPISGACCSDADLNGICDPIIVTQEADLLKIGVLWLKVDYSLPKVAVPFCEVDTCQAQSKAMGSTYSRDGKIYQQFSSCNCVAGTCRCENIENVMGTTGCDQKSCQSQSKAIGAAYTRDGKFYQEFSNCDCVDGACQCENIEKVIGTTGCDQQSCQSKSRAMGTAYSRDGKIYQEFSYCNCVEEACHCENIEKAIGVDEKPPILPPPTVTLPGIGNLTFKPPDSKYMVVTSEWGEVPVNQVLVVLKDNESIRDLETLANLLHGQIVGYDDSINLYQIETSGKTEADLRDAISRAKAFIGVDLAFPNQKLDLYLSPLDDPVYSGNRGASYEIAGVQKAWEFIRNSSITLSAVRIGVVDDGIYKGFGEFNGTAVNINTDDDEAELMKPSSDPKFSFAGSHGTGVMNVLAADPNNGGLVGIASEALRLKLTVYMSNYNARTYGGQFTGVDEAMSKQLMWKVTILSLSVGINQADNGTYTIFKRKLQLLAKNSPDVLLVCAAGNEGKPMNGSRCVPGGFNFSNVITVGSILNNGKNLTSSLSSDNFEVSLAAPGEEVIWYGDKTLAYKNRHYGGTSMAAPMVAGAAAIIRSLNSSLNASEIKTILLQTARPTVKVGSKEVRVPQKVGGRVLAIDLAVQRVIDSNRNATLK